MLQARQSGNLPFNFGGIDQKVNAAEVERQIAALAGFRCPRQNIGVAGVG